MPRAAALREGVVVDEDEYVPGDFPPSPTAAAAAASTAAGASTSGGASTSAGEPPAPAPWPRRFPGLRAAVDAAIARLGGAVAPKLNWSSPSDALWVAGANSLRCTSADQVVLLLKSSDRAAYDIELLRCLRAHGSPAPPALALRRWHELRPEREFRCFVHAGEPAGICQRDATQFFPQLQDAAEQSRIKAAVCGFQRRRFGGGFAHGSCAPRGGAGR
jgi:hypothetical protein